jgi:hypothetical protein
MNGSKPMQISQWVKGKLKNKKENQNKKRNWKKHKNEKNIQSTKLHKKTKLQQIVVGLNGDAQDQPTWNK